ncbi:restriction endonuclease subunit S [Thiohalophilus thiocyanatoxydans]|uniref:Type I restriction enzyme S subunit n=1 Tax=Thiohalophilus thiocyanatoxydans TaxID=381308 RepID=A0A4R8IPL6_9GAMM|nr:restriction endonuclease subunit S [Thiohalophilus thiocyanatoxydans]TDY02856.1 type I restriction enzyme S subunit [Thiohalophilus thiocyanatoxydans]
MDIQTDILESMCELVVDCPHSTPKWKDSGLIVLRNQNIRNGRLDLSDPSFTNEEHFKQRIKRAEPRPGDIVFTREAPMGEVCMIPEGVKCCLGQRQVLLRPKKDVNSKYLLFALQSPAVQHEISWNEGTGSTVSNVRIPVLKNLNIPRHPGSEDAIAEILSSLSDKIELNRQINQTLEQIAQAIFKSWFVDFEPVKAKIQAKQNGQDPKRAAMRAISGKTDEELEQLSKKQYKQLAETAALFPDELEVSELGEIPKGWGVTNLGQILEFNPKRTLKKGELAPYLDMKNVPTQGHIAEDVYLREMGSGTKFINGDTLLARITPCLENGKTAFVDFLDEDQVGWGSTEYIVMRPKDNRPLSLGYIIARQESFRTKAIQTMTGTSGRQRANAKAIAEQKWLDYPHELLKAFDKVSGGYLSEAKKNGEENRLLPEIRDVLLPKLLTGEVSVEGAQSTTEAVA